MNVATRYPTWRLLGHAGALRATGTSTARRWQSSYSHLEHEMKTRKIRPVFDDLTPQYSYRLDTSLADFIPDTM